MFTQKIVLLSTSKDLSIFLFENIQEQKCTVLARCSNGILIQAVRCLHTLIETFNGATYCCVTLRQVGIEMHSVVL